MPLGGIMPSQPPGGDRLRRVGARRRDGREGGDDPADSVTRAADQAELTSTPGVLNSERARHVVANDSEDAHEDHLSSPNYQAKPPTDSGRDPRQPRLNLRG